MSKFAFDLDNEKFDFECPECGRKVCFRGRDINHDVKCPNCKSSIHLDGRDFDKQIKNIEKQINSLFG
ncbi:MAG: RNHCP domain-containing protein [Lachnospiraceae bacterium]|nr:RNHCP domain-containing protein [Lachnospiraceae bacterium]